MTFVENVRKASDLKTEGLMRALKDAIKPINVASYHIVKELPKEFRDELPQARLLEFIE